MNRLKLFQLICLSALCQIPVVRASTALRETRNLQPPDPSVPQSSSQYKLVAHVSIDNDPHKAVYLKDLEPPSPKQIDIKTQIQHYLEISSATYSKLYICLLVTDVEPDDVLAIMLLIMSEEYATKCKNGVVVALVWATEEKEQLLRQLFELAGKQKPIIFEGATSENSNKDLPFIDTETHAKVAIYELLNLNAQIDALVIAPCRDLTDAVEKIKFEEKLVKERLGRINQIVIAGGWIHGEFRASYNFLRDSHKAFQLLSEELLAKKILISSKHASTYDGSMNSKSFPALINTLRSNNQNLFIQRLLHYQVLWDASICGSKINHESVNRAKDSMAGHTHQFCSADVLAAMCMFHSQLISAKEDITYQVDLYAHGGQWDLAYIKPTPLQESNDIYPKTGIIENLGTITSTVIMKIDDSSRPDSPFKTKLIALLKKFIEVSKVNQYKIFASHHRDYDISQ